MTAQIVTDAGSPVPADLMEKWCEMWADGDRRLRADEIALNVLGGRPASVPGQLWQRVSGSTVPSRNAKYTDEVDDDPRRES